MNQIIPSAEERNLSEEETEQMSRDFLNHSFDMIKSAKILLENGDVFQIFPAAFLAHLGLELLLKANLIKVGKVLLFSHDLKRLFERAPFSKRGLGNEDRKAIAEFTKYHRLRYPDDPWDLGSIDPGEPAGIGPDDIARAIDLYLKIRERVLPEFE